MARSGKVGRQRRQGAAAEPAVDEGRYAAPERKAVNAIGLVDVVGALAADTLAGSLFLFDNNRCERSSGNGSLNLGTPLAAGDVLLWTCLPLETEAFARIDDIRIDARYADHIALDCGVFTDTTVVYWMIRILKRLPEPVPYWLVFQLGSAPEPLVVPTPSYLIPGDPQVDDTVDLPRVPDSADAAGDA